MYFSATTHWDGAHTINLIAWIIQATLCIPMLLLLKYESNTLREEACNSENDKNKANFLRYLSYTATWSSLFFAWLFFHSILHANSAYTAAAGIDAQVPESIFWTNYYIGALLTLLNGGNFAYIAYRMYKNAFIAKKANDQKNFLINLSGAMFETGIVIIYALLCLFWTIALFPDSASHKTGALTSDKTAYILLIISLVCFACATIACFGIHLKRTNLKNYQDTLTLKRKIVEVVQFCVLTSIVIAFGLITLTGFIINAGLVK